MWWTLKNEHIMVFVEKVNKRVNRCMQGRKDKYLWRKIDFQIFIIYNNLI